MTKIKGPESSTHVKSLEEVGLPIALLGRLDLQIFDAATIEQMLNVATQIARARGGLAPIEREMITYARSI